MHKFACSLMRPASTSEVVGRHERIIVTLLRLQHLCQKVNSPQTLKLRIQRVLRTVFFRCTVSYEAHVEMVADDNLILSVPSRYRQAFLAGSTGPCQLR